MGPQEDYIETVVTCEGDFHDPQLQDRLRRFQQRLESLLIEDGKKQLILKKVEPWNSVRVTFSIPKQAALRLKQMAQQGSAILRQIGVLGVQIQGDRLVSLTVATSNNQRAEVIISTHDSSGQGSGLGAQQNVSVTASIDPGMPSSSEEQGSPGPNMEVTRKNIKEYLRLFNSIPASTSAAGPSRAGSSHDILKTPTSADGNTFRINNIAVDGVPDPSSLSGVPERSAFVRGDSHGHGPVAMQQGVNVPASGHHGPRMSVAQHTPLPPQKYNITQQKQQHQQPSQLSAQATSLPQTAALGYNMMGLPPPPPYPHGHGTGIANHVGRQAKKPPASSPLLINLLQTEPVAGSNSVMAAPGAEKKVKKHRKRREKQASATGTPDGQLTTQGMPSLPSESDPFSGGVPPQTMPSQEEMSAVLHRRVSPVPLPSPRFSVGFSSSVPVSADVGNGGDGFRDRKPSTASAALASLAHSQKSTSESEQVGDNSIINPYTGHMEPRDSASDLSPVKQDQFTSRKSSHTEGTRNETSVSCVSVNTQVSLAAAKEDVKLSSSDSLRLGLGSFQPGSTVPSSLREERPRGYSSSLITSVVSSEHSLVSDSLFGQSSDAGHAKVTTESSTLPNSAAPHIYAQQTFGPSQPLPRAPHVAPLHSTHTHTPKAGTSTVNGPVYVTTPSSSFPVSGQLSTESQLLKSRVVLEGGMVDPYHLASHKSRSSGRGDVVHNVSVGHEAKVDDNGGQLHGDTGSHQPVTVSVTQPLAHKAIPVLEMRTSVASVSAVAAQAQSDSLKLLNSSVSLGVAQCLAADSAIPTASTASPAAIKTPSDGEDNNSNHSGISPVSTVAPAPSSLLDTNGTKVDNHDSGMGSSSERSDDTTPSEVGDGEFQTSAPPSESSAADNGSSKAAVVVKKTVVNCKKEATGSSEAHTITVGYVQMNQHSADPYNKETKKYMADSSSPLIGDKSVVDETLREVSNLIKSSPSMMPGASQMALASHKDVTVSLPLPTKINNLPYQQVLLKHKTAANCQVSDVHQNGPSSQPPRVQSQHLQGQHIASSMHSNVHHSTGITVSHHQGQIGISQPPPSTVNNPVPHQQAENMQEGQNYSGWPHPTSSVSNNMGQGGHLPSSKHSQVVRTGLHPSTAAGGQPPGLATQVPGCVAGETSSVSSQSSSHNSQITGGLQLSASQTAGSSVGLSKNKGHSVAGRDLTNPVTQELHPAGKPLSQPAQRITNQGHTSHTSSASAPHRTLHPVSVAISHSQHTTIAGSLGLSVYCSSASLAPHTQGSSFQGSSPQVPISQSPASLVSLSQNPGTLSLSLNTAGVKMAKTLPSLPSSTSVLKTTATPTLPTAGPHPTSSLGSHSASTSSTQHMATSNVLHSASSEVESRGHVTHTTISSAQPSEGAVVKHPPPNASSSNAITISSVSVTTGVDLGSVASDFAPDSSLSDFAMLEDSNPHGDDLFCAEDLALISEPGLSAYLDVGIRHGTTNGNMSVSTETRAGANITSMYTKRSSPINVNMLNHIYAAGLPQPRRLTESVQRLVKPLPNPENSLLPGRACKSPSASSRHSSNGSGSPGRASQGGSRSPGASLSATSPARNLVFDKLLPNLSSAPHSSSGNAGNNSVTPQLARPAYGGSLNCINTSVIPAAPHPLATLQSSSSSRHKVGNGSAVPPTVSVALSSIGVASNVAVPSSSTTSSFSSALCSTHTVTPCIVSNSAVPSHTHGNSSAALKDTLSSRLQLDHVNFSSSGPVSKLSVSSTGTFHSPHSHQSSPVSVAQPDMRQPETSAEGSVTNGVSSPAVSVLPGSAAAVCNRITVRLPPQAVPPGSHASVPVCNTLCVENVTSKTNAHSVSHIQPLLTSLPSVHHLSPASLSSPVVSSSSSGVVQLQHIPAACSCTHLQTSTVTSVTSSFDLSSHVTVVTGGCTHPASAATSSVCSTTLAASKSTDFPMTPRLVSAGHPITTVSQQGLVVSGSVLQRNTSLNADSSTSISSEVKSDYTGQTSDSAHKPSTVPPSLQDNVTQVTSSGRTVSLPASPTISSQKDLGVLTTVSSLVRPQSVRSSIQTNVSASERHASESPGTADSIPHSARLESVEGQEKVDGENSKSASMTVSQHSLQDSTPDSQCGQSENPHSKPPLLHPAPPLTLPALIPSATPPPPPLTPVLLQDATKKEVISSPNQPSLASTVEAEADGTVSSDVQDSASTVSSFFLAGDSTAGTDKRDAQESMVSEQSITDCKRVEDILKDGTPTHVTTNDTGDSEGLTNEPPVALSLDEGNLKTRRLTRKRKSTNSESDSSSEPAPKLSCVESSVSGNNLESTKTITTSDVPPKLHKEGKKSHPIDKADDEKGGKKAEDRLSKKEEEERGEKKEEEKPGLKTTTHHDRNILDATPEEVAKKMAAAGSKRRVHYTYVLEKVSPGQSYFDTPVLSGRTRSQGSKGSKESSSGATGVTTTISAASSSNQTGGLTGGTGKDESGDTAAAGSKRSTRSLRTKDTGESTLTKRKRAKEHR